MSERLPEWITYPEDDWTRISAQDAGFDERSWQRYLQQCQVHAAWEGKVHDSNDWGAVLTRAGYLVHSWGDRRYKFQTASVGKAFSWAAFGLAVDEGLVKPDDVIRTTWTGEGQLSSPHKSNPMTWTVATTGSSHGPTCSAERTGTDTWAGFPSPTASTGEWALRAR